jgi:hypothetical protein
MQIKFSDGTALDVLAVNGQPVYFQGAQRDSLEIQIDKSAITFGALDTLTGDAAKTDKLTILDGEHQYEHNNYSLRVSLALRPVVTAVATDTTPEQAEDRFCVTLAQKTYAELQIEQQAAGLTVLGQQVAAMALADAKRGAAS